MARIWQATAVAARHVRTFSVPCRSTQPAEALAGVVRSAFLARSSRTRRTGVKPIFRFSPTTGVVTVRAILWRVRGQVGALRDAGTLPPTPKVGSGPCSRPYLRIAEPDLSPATRRTFQTRRPFRPPPQNSGQAPPLNATICISRDAHRIPKPNS